jgi:hypothetical protein
VGCRYDGQWLRSRWEGWGRMEYCDGSVYEGDWRAGQRQGQGQLTHHMEVEADPAGDGSPNLSEGGQGGQGGQGAFEAPEGEFDFEGEPAAAAAAATQAAVGVGVPPVGLGEINHNQQHMHPHQQQHMHPHQQQQQQQSTHSIESVLHTYGGVYMGHWEADEPHGEGCVVLRNGQVSTGAGAVGGV